MTAPWDGRPRNPDGFGHHLVVAACFSEEVVRENRHLIEMWWWNGASWDRPSENGDLAPAQAARLYRYLGPVSSPSEVARLREENERLRAALLTIRSLLKPTSSAAVRRIGSIAFNALLDAKEAGDVS